MTPENENPTNSSKIEFGINIDRAENNNLAATVSFDGDSANLLRQAVGGPTVVTLDRSASKQTADQPLWTAIRNRTLAISFNQYDDFIRATLCGESSIGQQGRNQETPEEHGTPSVADRLSSLELRPTIYGSDAYDALKLATEAFLIFQCGVLPPNDRFVDVDQQAAWETEESNRHGRSFSHQDIIDGLRNYLGNEVNRLPYLDRIVRQIVGLNQDRQAEDLPYCDSLLQRRLTCPSMIELIWSYWEEEAMLVQTMNVLSMRFQNKRSRQNDPLANFELDPLRPLNNLMWGFIQDESRRLGIQRRAYEYVHHYGFSLVGKAISDFQPADNRSKFVEAFHNLLHYTTLFYREDDDTTVVADAFKLLNALREVHLILSEGAHNQYGDLPWTARKEMLMMQWMLARSETKEFLRGRYMTPYQEPWMGAVDDMKRLQGWGDVTVTHYHELAMHGEQILLSVRFGDWIVENNQETAQNWARYWRPEIQRYIHAYQAVTGVDLTTEVSDVRMASDRYIQPSILLDKRLSQRNASPKKIVKNRPKRLEASSRSNELLEYSAEFIPNRHDY